MDALWPRGVSKADLHAEWHKDVAPSAELRKTFHHDAERWDDFREAYLAELAEPKHEAALNVLIGAATTHGEGPLMLVYAARDTEHNNARVLQEAIEVRLH